MARDFFTLYFSLICGHLGLDALSDGGGKLKRAATAVVVFIFGSFFILTEVLVFIPVVNATVEMAYPALAMELAVLFSAIPGLLMGFCFTMRSVIFAGDLVLLAPLPVKRIVIFRSKVAFAYTGCLLASAAVLLPAFIVYSSIAGGGIGFWLRGIVVMFLFPVLTLTAGAMLASPIALACGNGRTASNLSKYVAMLTVPVLDVLMALACVKSGEGGANIAAFITDHWAQLKAWSVPPFSWASLAVCSGGMTSNITLAMFLITVFVCIFLSNWILRSMFVRRVSRVLATPLDRAMK